MDLSTPTSRFTDTAPSERLHGPDVVRAVALIGVIVMNYHGYLILRSFEAGTARPRTGWLEELMDPWSGPLSTRFAATFVLVAGVSVTLLTRRTIDDPARIGEMRWRLIRRGLLLFVLGLVLDTMWPGTIIVYYGVMFVLAAAIFTWRSRWIIAVGAGAALAAAVIRIWRFERERDGHSTDWLTRPDPDSVQRYVFDMFVNGTHPLLPWFAFLCAGIVLGRVLGASWWRTASISVGLALLTVASLLSTLATTDLRSIAFSVQPLERSLVYTASALGTALLAYAVIDWFAQQFPTATDPLRRAGQLTLSLYIAHILVFKLIVDWFGWIEPAGADLALLFALVFWLVAVATGMWWQRRFGRGPAEYVYRAFGG